MASPQSPNTMSLNLKNLTTVIAVGILVGTEVFAVALAAGWAIAGLFELGDTVALILMGLFSLAGIWIMIKFVRQALSVEPLRS
jgi:hypothetical protein